MNRNRKYPWRESTLALPAGRWILRGGVKHFQPAQPQLDFQCDDMADNAPEQDVWDTIAANLGSTPSTPQPQPVITLCEDCGCALAPNERCPRCLVWALRAEELWSWERQRFANRHVIWTILDARESVAA